MNTFINACTLYFVWLIADGFSFFNFRFYLWYNTCMLKSWGVAIEVRHTRAYCSHGRGWLACKTKIRNSLVIEAEGEKNNKKLDNQKMILCIYWTMQNIFYRTNLCFFLWKTISGWTKILRKFCRWL